MTRSWTKYTAWAAVAVIAALAAGCKEGGIGGTMTRQQEHDYGTSAAADLDKRLKYIDDGKLNARILQIALPVFAEANKDRSDVTFRVRIVDDKDVNAFSIPGGYIYLNKGLLDKLGNDDDAVACIIGHESAHVVRRHLVKQLADYNGKGLVVDLVAILARSNTVANVGGAAVNLQALHFSRQDEYEADRLGERYAYNAGYDPAGMLRTFVVLQQLEKKEGGHDPAYALDHPITRNRAIRALEQLRELRANKGLYIGDKYDPLGDQTAAKMNGIDYPQLVLATSKVTPSPIAITAGPSDATAGGEKK